MIVPGGGERRVRRFLHQEGSRGGWSPLSAYNLDRKSVELLLAVIEKFGGGPVGVDNLAAAIGEDNLIHFDEDAAKDSIFGGLIASGWHTGAMIPIVSTFMLVWLYSVQTQHFSWPIFSLISILLLAAICTTIISIRNIHHSLRGVQALISRKTRPRPL